MFLRRNKKNNVYPCKPQVYYIKVGLRGLKLYRHVFVMPILALNCLLQIEQERSEEESSVGDALAMAFRCARFCSASLILFASYSPAPFFLVGLVTLYDLVQSVPMTLLVC